ncbi:MAG TPA: hypothetical protein G4N92_09120 [Anaerolineae bacterium]|nr:hypothetical protein [Anaerolineae bacterium]
MNQEDNTLEIVASSVEEAIQEGLKQLNLTREGIEVEIIDKGGRDLLGIGKHQAKVRLIVKKGSESLEGDNVVKEETQLEEGDNVVGSIESEPVDKYELAQREAEQIVKDLIGFMKVPAKVKAKLVEPEDERDRPMILVEITGRNLSILIGRRSETLNALQYITRLVLCQRLGNWMPISLDVQGYRFRRERQLRQLARRLADQVVQTSRKQVLEPMPANERRIIHLELRYHPFVTTESIGEEPTRRTSIFLKPKD